MGTVLVHQMTSTDLVVESKASFGGDTALLRTDNPPRSSHQHLPQYILNDLWIKK